MLNIIKKILFPATNLKRSLFFFWSGETKAKSLEDIYSGLVFRCVDLIAQKVASVDLYMVDEKGKKVYDEFLQILNPTPYGLNKFDLLYLITAHIQIYGRALLQIKIGEMTKKPRYLIPLNPSKISIEVKEKINYVYFNDKNEKVILSPNDVLDIKIPHPFNIYQGMSVIEAVRLELENDLASIETTKRLFENSAIPSGVLSTQNELSEDGYKRLVEQLKENYSGLNNFYKPMVLEGGLKWESISLPPKDLQFIEKRAFTRDQILAIFKVPKAVLFATDVNRANSEAAKYWFAEYTIKPYVNLIVDKLNFLNQRLGGKNTVVADEIIPEDKEYKLKLWSTLINKAITANEIRQELGFKPLPGGDELKVELGLKSIIRNPTDISFIELRDKYLIKEENLLKQEIMIIYKDLIDGIKNKKDLLMADRLIENLKEIFKAFREQLGKQLAKRMIKTAERAIEHIEEIYKFEIAWDLENTGAINYLSHKINSTSDLISENLKRRVREIIIDEININKKPTLEIIIDRLNEELSDDIDWFAERIARSELIEAYNYSSNEIIKSTKGIEKKKWITAKDDRVCPICQNLDEEVISKYETFSGGIEYKAHPQCRCAIVPVFD